MLGRNGQNWAIFWFQKWRHRSKYQGGLGREISKFSKNYYKTLVKISLMGDGTMGGLLPNFCWGRFFHISTEFLSKPIRYVMEISFSNFCRKNKGKIAGMMSRDLEKCGSRPPLSHNLVQYNNTKNFQKIHFRRPDFRKNRHDCSF